jgi:cytoskeletal protein CcmA (bactofilin family)
MLSATERRELKVTEPFWKSNETSHVPDPPLPQPKTEHQPGVQNNEIEARTLVVGAGVSVSGSISSCDRLIAKGNVDAQLDDCQHLIVAKTGAFRGNVSTDNADVHGRVEGDLVIRKRLVVRSTGHVSGTITYDEIEIECGGKISGQFKPDEGGNAVSYSKPTQAGKDPLTRSDWATEIPPPTETTGSSAHLAVVTSDAPPIGIDD